MSAGAPPPPHKSTFAVLIFTVSLTPFKIVATTAASTIEVPMTYLYAAKLPAVSTQPLALSFPSSNGLIYFFPQCRR